MNSYPVIPVGKSHPVKKQWTRASLPPPDEVSLPDSPPVPELQPNLRFRYPRQGPVPPRLWAISYSKVGRCSPSLVPLSLLACFPPRTQGRRPWIGIDWPSQVYNWPRHNPTLHQRSPLTITNVLSPLIDLMCSFGAVPSLPPSCNLGQVIQAPRQFPPFLSRPSQMKAVPFYIPHRLP